MAVAKKKRVSRRSNHGLYVSPFVRDAIRRHPAAFAIILVRIAREARRDRLRHWTDNGHWYDALDTPGGRMLVRVDFANKKTVLWMTPQEHPSSVRFTKL
jgi:hypothetical protein